MTPPSSATATAPQVIELRPQAGKQELFHACAADILIYGGGAGGGKTWSLMNEPFYHYKTPGFGAVIFRRTYPEITHKGGMWDESQTVYPLLGGKPNKTELEWTFPINPAQSTTIKFAHCQYDQNVYAWKGAQIPLIGIDQVESFTEFQFWYLLSRNRSLCGVPPYLRATCNPVPSDDKTGGWLHQLIAWWLDCDCPACLSVQQPVTGLGVAREDRAGVVRWLARINDELKWGDTLQDMVRQWPGLLCHLSVTDCAASNPEGLACEKPHAKTFTFIPAKLSDNPILRRTDPGYEATLHALPKVERERLLGCNWKMRPSAGNVFNRAWFKIVPALPAQRVAIRYWDKAGTEDGGCQTAGVKISYSYETGCFYVEDVITGQWSAWQREQVIKQTAQVDGENVEVWVEQEPGSGGKESAENTVRNLAGYIIRVDPVRGDKFTRAGPFSAQAEAGNVCLLEAAWNKAYLDELHSFAPESGQKDQVDASSGAFNKLAAKGLMRELFHGGPKPVTTEQVAKQEVDTSIMNEIRRGGLYFPQRG